MFEFSQYHTYALPIIVLIICWTLFTIKRGFVGFMTILAMVLVAGIVKLMAWIIDLYLGETATVIFLLVFVAMAITYGWKFQKQNH